MLEWNVEPQGFTYRPIATESGQIQIVAGRQVERYRTSGESPPTQRRVNEKNSSPLPGTSSQPCRPCPINAGSSPLIVGRLCRAAGD